METEEKQGQRPISREMTVLDIVSQFRMTQDVFKEYDRQAGECICCQALFERLDDVAKRYDLDIDRLVHDLNEKIRSDNRERPV